VVPGTSTPLSVDNVNCGAPYHPPSGQNCSLYRTNDCDSLNIPWPCASIATEMDGMTVALCATGPLLSGWNHIKLAIADVSDTTFDSNVFIRRHDCSLSPGVDICIPSANQCPCANPPSLGSRGCDNGAFTGGGSLSSTGRAGVAHGDTLTFTAKDLPNGMMALLLHSKAAAEPGLPFHHGYLCMKEPLLRVSPSRKTVNGIVAFGAAVGAASIWTSACVRGDCISSCSTRYYCVWYRDPAILWTCDPLPPWWARWRRQTSLNYTQGQSIVWQ